MSHHLDSIKRQIPFYSWECLTIQCEDRDVDMVIKNQEDMQKLLKFLIYHQHLMANNHDLVLVANTKWLKSKEG